MAQFLELKELSQQKELVLVEAITNQYAKTYLALKEYLDQLWVIKIVACNYSQFSSRYAKFKEGDIHPVFNPAMAGGALMDINLYNIHFTVGLFGLPDEVHYRPNVENGVDTSGILLMDYPGFICVCIGAKDSTGSNHVNIQGNAGFIHDEAFPSCLPKIPHLIFNLTEAFVQVHFFDAGDGENASLQERAILVHLTSQSHHV